MGFVTGVRDHCANVGERPSEAEINQLNMFPPVSGKTNSIGRRGPIRLQRSPPSLAKLDMTKRAVRVTYDRDLFLLQRQLKEVTLAYRARGLRAVIVFEGSDASGKGGAIRRISWPLDPRGLKVWPIAAPTQEEKEHHYLYRFWRRLPQRGQMAIFDRSWYGRVLVERVEGFARVEEWRRAYSEINEFERMLGDDGIRLVKLFLHITADEQLSRFQKRFREPLNRWKLSEEDLRNRARWSEYQEATDEMFRKTSTVAHPWHVIPSNDKRYSRLTVIETVVRTLSKGVEMTLPELDPAFEQKLRQELGVK